MKKLQKLGVLAVLAIALFSLQNCSTSDEVLEQESVESSSQTVSGRFVNIQEDNLYNMRFTWPEGTTEAEKNWTRNYYLDQDNEFIYISAIGMPEGISLSNNFEHWVVEESSNYTRFCVLTCDVCSPPDGTTFDSYAQQGLIAPLEIIENEPVSN